MYAAVRSLLCELLVPFAARRVASLTARAPQLGLLVGKLAVGSRDFALAVVPTPWADGEPPAEAAPPPAAPAGKKGKPAGASSAAAVAALPVDEEWICEHARQARRRAS